MKFQLYNRSLLSDTSLKLCTDLQFLQGKASLQKNISEEKIPEPLADIGFIGLSVLSQNLILNMNDHGYVLAVYDNIRDITSAFSKNEADNTNITCVYSIEELIGRLKTPKVIMIYGHSDSFEEYERRIDSTIEKLITLLLPGDIIVDLSESFDHDTKHRAERLESTGILFVGCGVVHDEDEARHGPLLMPGGNSKAWPHIKPIFQAICSKIDGQPSCKWIGEKHSGHLVLWNYLNIEEKELQLIEETYMIMHYALYISHKEISDIFKKWNVDNMKSSALEIFSGYLRENEEIDKRYRFHFLSRYGQEESGRFTAITHPEASSVLQFQSLYYRCLYTINAPWNQSRRQKIEFEEDKEEFLEQLKNSLYASIVFLYADHAMPLKSPYEPVNFDLQNKDILRMYKGSSFFRSAILDRLIESMDNDHEMNNCLFADYVIEVMDQNIESIREVVKTTYKYNIPVYQFTSIMNYYDITYKQKMPRYIHMLRTRTYTSVRYPTLEEVTTYVNDGIESSS